MRIVVNHLTRMDAPRICIAGIDPDTGRHVRPTTGALRPLTRELLAEQGGPLALGSLVELGYVRPDPKRPETEDHLFHPEKAQRLGQLTPNRYLELLLEHAGDRLEGIFGDALVRHDWNYAVDKNHGTASLGILRVKRKPDIDLDDYGKLRLRLNDEDKPAFLSVTDLRFVEADHKTQEGTSRRRERAHAQRSRGTSDARSRESFPAPGRRRRAPLATGQWDLHDGPAALAASRAPEFKRRSRSAAVDRLCDCLGALHRQHVSPGHDRQLCCRQLARHPLGGRTELRIALAYDDRDGHRQLA